MNLDDLERFKQLDSQDMLSQIDGLPEQLAAAWAAVQSHPLPSIGHGGISNVVIAGMGGSAIGGDLVAAYSLALSETPIFVHRDYGLPGFAHGPGSLVIVS